MNGIQLRELKADKNVEVVTGIIIEQQKDSSLYDEILLGVRWINLMTQTELYYHFDFVFILSTSLYTYLDSRPQYSHRTDDGDDTTKYYDGNNRVCTIQLSIFLVSTCSMILYFGHKFFLRERRFEIKMHRMVSLLFNHIVQFGTIGTIALCAAGNDKNITDDHRIRTNGKYTFHCTDSFLAITYLKLVWHLVSMIWALTIRWEYTSLGMLIYLRICVTGMLNLFEPYVPQTMLHKSVLELNKFLERYEEDSIMKEDSAVDILTSPVQSPMAPDKPVIIACEVHNETAEKSLPFYSAFVLPYVNWINSCTVSELYGHIQFSFIFGTNLYFVLNPLSLMQVIQLGGGGGSIMVYFGHKFYLCERRFECKAHRLVALLFNHMVQLLAIASIALCEKDPQLDGASDDDFYPKCSESVLVIAYVVVSWHCACLLWALTLRWSQTWLSLVFYYRICYTGILNILEPYVPQDLLRKSVVELNKYLEGFESDSVIREGAKDVE